LGHSVLLFNTRFGILDSRITSSKIVVELNMPHGRSQESRELRRHLLSHNGPSVAEWMTKSEYDDPVGLIETTDDIGKQRPKSANNRSNCMPYPVLSSPKGQYPVLSQAETAKRQANWRRKPVRRLSTSALFRDTQ